MVKYIYHYAMKQGFFVGTATLLVILLPHIIVTGQGGGVLLLRYSIICVSGLAIFDLNGRGENRSPSLLFET